MRKIINECSILDNNYPFLSDHHRRGRRRHLHNPNFGPSAATDADAAVKSQYTPDRYNRMNDVLAWNRTIMTCTRARFARYVVVPRSRSLQPPCVGSETGSFFRPGKWNFPPSSSSSTLLTSRRDTKAAKTNEKAIGIRTFLVYFIQRRRSGGYGRYLWLHANSKTTMTVRQYSYLIHNSDWLITNQSKFQWPFSEPLI